MTNPKAFLFDLNGTMIDDMACHLEVWYEVIVNELGGKLSKEEVKHHLYGKSQEVLVRIFGKDRFSNQQLDDLSMDKERRYQQLYRSQMDLLPGLFSFLESAHEADIKMAIGSAAIPFNIDFIIDTLKLRHYFGAIVSADDVKKSKPHPETFLECARRLNIAPEHCVVFEDAPKGVECAQLAGMKTVVLTTTHPVSDFSAYSNILMFVDDYQSITPQSVLQRSGL